MERGVTFLADTSGPFKQLLAAEQTAQSVQAWIQEKKDEISTIKRQAIDQDIPFMDIYEHTKLLEYDIGAFKRLLEYNEESRCIWRRAHAAASRATIRPLKVVDMPNEILTTIFAKLEHVPVPQTQFDITPLDQSLPTPDLAIIKNIRLTCRAFCEVGSEFLTPVLKISFSRPSLQRLEEISSHPSISKGVRVVQFDISPYSDSLRGYNEFSYATYRRFGSLRKGFSDKVLDERRGMAETFRMNGNRAGFMASTADVFNVVDNDGSVAIVNALDVLNFPRRSWDTEPLNPLETRIRDAISRAHEEFNRRRDEQRSLFENQGVYADILSSIRRMPSAQRICITDRNDRRWHDAFRTGWDNRLNLEKYNAMIVDSNPFHDLMVQPGVYEDATAAEYGEPPMSLLCYLPSMFQAVSQNLTHLDIDIRPSPSIHMEISDGDPKGLRDTCQHLRALKLRFVRGLRTVAPRGMSHECFAMTKTMLGAMVASPELEELRLSLIVRRAFRQADSATILSSVLPNLSGNTLRGVELADFPIKIEEIRHLSDRAAGKLHLEMDSTYLMNGTWAQVLDILRGKTDSTSQIVFPQGGEMIGMSRREYWYFRREFRSEHRDGWYSDQRCPGPASFYIRGGNISNPLI